MSSPEGYWLSTPLISFTSRRIPGHVFSGPGSARLAHDAPLLVHDAS